VIALGFISDGDIHGRTFQAASPINHWHSFTSLREKDNSNRPLGHCPGRKANISVSGRTRMIGLAGTFQKAAHFFIHIPVGR
jgi:hypothetical protein